MTPRTAFIRMTGSGCFEYFQTAAYWAQKREYLRRNLNSRETVDSFFSHARPQVSRPPTVEESIAALRRGKPIPQRVLAPERTLDWVAPYDLTELDFISGRVLMKLGVERWAKKELAGVDHVMVWDCRHHVWHGFDVDVDGYEGLAACLRKQVW